KAHGAQLGKPSSEKPVENTVYLGLPFLRCAAVADIEHDANKSRVTKGRYFHVIQDSRDWDDKLGEVREEEREFWEEYFVKHGRPGAASLADIERADDGGQVHGPLGWAFELSLVETEHVEDDIEEVEEIVVCCDEMHL
ncbi:hypothetical protein EWM64_g10349, partial [Hericium alpestre]